MNTPSRPSPTHGGFLLIVASLPTLETIFELIAQLSLKGPLNVLDGGNSFQGYRLARILRRQVVDVSVPLQRVWLSRAFTCYQLSAAIQAMNAADSRPHPLFVLDYLLSFYDQGVPITNRRRLLDGCLRQLQALSGRGPVVVWVRQRTAVPLEALSFLDQVRLAAGQVWGSSAGPVLPVERQLPLFSA